MTSAILVKLKRFTLRFSRRKNRWKILKLLSPFPYRLIISSVTKSSMKPSEPTKQTSRQLN